MTVEFLEQVITTPEGYFCLATLNGYWQENWFRWPEDKHKIIEAANQYKDDRSVYFSTHLFSEQSSARNLVLPSRTIAADLDYAIVPGDLQPSVLVQTSPERHQGYWILAQNPPSTDELEEQSRSLTYHIPDCDKGCWQLGHKMRLPGTFNYKYPERPQVQVVSRSLVPYKSLPIVRRKVREREEEEWTPAPVEDETPLTLLAKVRKRISAKVYAQYGRQQSDRSEALWALMCSLFQAGLDRDQVFYLAKNSANNKFADSKYNADRDLARDVLRAEKQTLQQQGDSVLTRLDAVVKSSSMTKLEKMRLQALLVYEDMGKHGRFLATPDGEWYVRNDTGRPIYISKHSPWLDSYLESLYHFNPTQPEQRYITAFLEGHTKEHGRRASIAQLSHYNPETGVVLLHTGRKDVLSIGRDSIQRVDNGQYDILFPWSNSASPFEPDFDHPIPLETITDGCFNNIYDLTQEEATALVRAWLMFLFLRDAIVSRPILACFGQPGSGKTTFFRRIYMLLYGPGKGVNSVTEPAEFDHAVSKDPLVCFDNVDGWTSWLPDKLALSASVSDLDKRKLYTDNDSSVLKRQALVGLTAHNPKFRREDIVDRLIMLNFERLKVFMPETKILSVVEKNRNGLWASVILDLQKVLKTPGPKDEEVPRFRISDYARIGLWISRALGFEEAFVSAINKNVQEQVAFNAEEESVLIDTLKKWLKAKPDRGQKFYKVQDLHNDLMLIGNEEFAKQFSRSLTLGRKLWTLQETLRSMFEIEVKHGVQREWRISLR